jgi:hypothetical protein|tara:strand:- start:65 stop:694 length:630 start_codon:yes stop_codon:yes gene_type:complete
MIQKHMIRKFFALLFLFSLASCATFSPLPLLADLEMDFPIEDPDNLSEGTIEVHSIEMSVGGSIGIDESFSTGLSFGVRASDYYSARFSDSNEIWFNENSQAGGGKELDMTVRINHSLRYYLNGWDYNSPFAEIRSNIVEGGADNLKTKVGFNITNIRLGYEWDTGTAVFLDKKIGRSSFEKHYEYNFPNYVSFGIRFGILPGGTLRSY